MTLKQREPFRCTQRFRVGDGNKKIRQINFQIAAISTTAFKINVDNCLKWP